MTTFTRRRLMTLAMLAAIVLAGCMQSQIDANNRQLAQQEAELDQLKQQVQALQNQGAQSSYATAPPSPNACDATVMREATRKGGERMAAGDPVKAIGYYQDAVTACPSSAEAQLNLAHADELIGDRAGALEHYRLAAASTGANADPAAIQKAQDAITRLGS
jgi:tetratricopeptide (TPR) repeat protein